MKHFVDIISCYPSKYSVRRIQLLWLYIFWSRSLESYVICPKSQSRDITLLTKVCIVKAMVFPVVMYRQESWTIKKAECWRIDAFKLWCWRRLLRVPWTAKRSNQSILKEINPECSLEGLMMKLKLHTLATWCKELTHWKRSWERSRAKGEEGRAEEGEMVR